jgi:nicotinamidase/pyrazinamidase
MNKSKKDKRHFNTYRHTNFTDQKIIRKDSDDVDLGEVDNPVITVISDVEGNWEYLERQVENNPLLTLVNGKLSFSHEMEYQNKGLDLALNNTHFVYCGDVMDQGNGFSGEAVVKCLLEFKLDWPNHVHLVLGNRDLNLLRFESELFRPTESDLTDLDALCKFVYTTYVDTDMVDKQMYWLTEGQKKKVKAIYSEKTEISLHDHLRVMTEVSMTRPNFMKNLCEEASEWLPPGKFTTGYETYRRNGDKAYQKYKEKESQEKGAKGDVDKRGVGKNSSFVPPLWYTEEDYEKSEAEERKHISNAIEYWLILYRIGAVKKIPTFLVNPSVLDIREKKGFLREYLEHAVIIDKVGQFLFVHGAVTEKNIGFVPTDKPGGFKKCSNYDGKDSKDSWVVSWVTELNNWFKSSMDKSEEANQGNNGVKKSKLAPSSDRTNALLDYALGGTKTKHDGASVMTASLEEYKSACIDEFTAGDLRRGNIVGVVSGHKPTGDGPRIIRTSDYENKDKDVFMISVDTSKSNLVLSKEDPTQLVARTRSNSEWMVVLLEGQELFAYGYNDRVGAYHSVVGYNKNHKHPVPVLGEDHIQEVGMRYIEKHIIKSLASSIEKEQNDKDGSSITMVTSQELFGGSFFGGEPDYHFKTDTFFRPKNYEGQKKWIGANRTLLIIDPQNDFCSKTGSMSVPGADDDCLKIAGLLGLTSCFNRVVVTLDAHPPVAIHNNSFWRHATKDGGKWVEGKQLEKGYVRPSVEPSFIVRRNTSITPAQEVIRKKTGSKNDGYIMTMRKEDEGHAMDYAKYVDKICKRKLSVWPSHCIGGTMGGNIVSSVAKAISVWQNAGPGREVRYVTKGQNSGTDSYSAMQAEMPDTRDAGTMFNHDLLRELGCAKQVVVCGQAKSHCVRGTVEDILNGWKKYPHSPQWKQANPSSSEEKNVPLARLILLSDCSSNVGGCEKSGKEFEDNLSEDKYTKYVPWTTKSQKVGEFFGELSQDEKFSQGVFPDEKGEPTEEKNFPELKHTDSHKTGTLEWLYDYLVNEDGSKNKK